MSYNKNPRRTGARASAVPLPPPPPLTDLAEWPYLESSAARTRNASATATGGNNRAQQRRGDGNGGSLPEQAAAEHEAHGDNSAVTEQGTTNLPEQAVLEPEAQVGTAIPRGSGMLAQEMPPEQQQPGESFQEFVDRHRRLALSVPVTWEDGPPSSLAPPNGDEPPPNNGAGATRPARDADSAPFPAEWWTALPEGLSPDKAKVVWLEKGRPNCTACGRAHPPPHSDLVARQNKQQRRQQKLEHRAKQQAAAAAPEVKKEPEEAERCQRCGNFHLGPCKAPWCDKCGSAHFKKKGEPCKERMEEKQRQQQPRHRRGGRRSRRRSSDRSASPRREDASGGMPSAEQQRRNIKAAILACRTEAQAKFWIDLFNEHVPGPELPEQQGQQQQQQQQDRPPPRQNQRGRSSHRSRGRSASPRREDSGGGSGSGYRERSPNTRRNAKKRGGRGPG